jgi:predicted phosphodiesterase
VSSDNQEKHLLISQVKELVSELGRIPSYNEFVARYQSHNKIKRLFIRWNDLVAAAGYAPLSGGARKKLSADVFERDIREVIQEYAPRQQSEKVIYTPTLIIGDTHFPFVSNKNLDFIYTFAQKHKPQRIVQIGDLYDLYAHSKFPKSLNIYKPEEETELARKGAEVMWKTLRCIVPQAECIQMKGNHDIRPLRQTLANLPALEHVIAKYIDELMSFEGVKLIEDSRQEYVVDGIQYIHGYRTGIGGHRDYALMNTICGHTHKGGVMYRRFRDAICWELNVGFVGDAESKALSYTPQKVHDCTNGLGWLDEYGPRFIAL